MTLTEIKRRVEHIRAIADDDERAHSQEDDLHKDVLFAIAKGLCESPKRAAEAALATRKIDFARWCS